MMTNMGWEGGALGRSGEGITEPLIPPLDRVAGAGLGHIAPPKKAKIPSPRKGNKTNNDRVRVCFRTELLQHTLNLVTSEDNTKEIQYTVPLCKKEKSFIKHVFMCINSRSNIGLESDEKVFYVNLLEELSRSADLQINVNISDNKMRIKLTKVFGKTGTAPLICKRKHDRELDTNKLSYYAPLCNNEYILITSSVINDNVAMVLPYCQSYMTNKSLLGLTFRMVVLVQILDFIKSEAATREVAFENELSVKQCMFIEEAVVRVNKKDRGGSTKLEANILTDIRECDIQFCLNVKFPASFGSKKMAFVLQKTSNENRSLTTTNRASEMTSNNALKNDSHKVNNCPIKEGKKDENSREKLNIVVTINNTNKHNSVIDGHDKLDNGYSNRDYGKISNECSPTLLSDKNGMKSLNDIDSPSHINSNKGISNVVDPDEVEYNTDDLESYLSDEEHMQMERDIKDKEFMNKEANGQRNNKRKQFNFDSDLEKCEDTKVFMNKYVRLVPKNYPKETADGVFAKKIQLSISKCLDDSNVLPLLKCHGVKNGALMYSCHTEKSFSWLANVCVASDIKIIDSKEICDTLSYKMAVRLNTFVDECYTRLFNRLEVYNDGLCTGKWVLVKKQKYSDFIVVTVKMDEKSLSYVKAAGFSLFAGLDEAKFSIIWD